MTAFSPRLVVMAKAPELGRVKTRLSRDIGPTEALRFYRQTLQETLRRLRDERRWRLELAVSPDTAITGAMWPSGCKRIPQGSGDLGKRMARLLAGERSGATVIVGSDIPGIRRSDIAEAFHALKGHDAVFGPARDGGYWLIGMRREAAGEGLFRHVRWSTEYSLEDTLADLAGRRVAFVRELRDVDTGADYLQWRRERTGSKV